MVATNVGGQATLFEKPLKYSESVMFPGRGKRLTGKKETAGVIGDGQRVAILTIAERRTRLVIRAPELIGSLPRAKVQCLARAGGSDRGARRNP